MPRFVCAVTRPPCSRTCFDEKIGASAPDFHVAGLSPLSGCAAATNGGARIASSIAQRLDRLMTGSVLVIDGGQLLT